MKPGVSVASPSWITVAPAGTFELGEVVDVTDAGVEPVVLVVPFCCVVKVAPLGVDPVDGVMPVDGVIP